MINVIRFQLHLELKENDVPDLVARGWLARDPHPKADLTQVQFTPKGKAEIATFKDAALGEAVAVGFRDITGRRWIIGTVKGTPVTTDAPTAVH